jgi:hypothetical protein
VSYIVVFLNVLVIYQTYHTGIHHLHHSLSPSTRIPEIVSTGIEEWTTGDPLFPKRCQLARGKNVPSPVQETSVLTRETLLL